MVTDLAVPAIAEPCELASPSATSSYRPDVLEVLRTGAAPLDPDRLIVPMKAAGRVIGTISLAAHRPRRRRRRTCSWPRTSACAPGRRWRMRGSTARRRGSRRRSRPPCYRRTCPTSRAAIWRPRYHPASHGLEVGGDFYDVFSTAEGQWYLVIGDVSGKGAEAAAVTALARYTLRSAAARRRSPASILRWVSEAMLDQDAAGGRFCTSPARTSI